MIKVPDCGTGWATLTSSTSGCTGSRMMMDVLLTCSVNDTCSNFKVEFYHQLTWILFIPIGENTFFANGVDHLYVELSVQRHDKRLLKATSATRIPRGILAGILNDQLVEGSSNGIAPS
ncbi:hypothetical protein H2248_005590 [Termitomyces sp. 'cryptogamus']|nr:hypothetical protein H2248_007029 [Termitomyces sp. 'cryptogamus']KAH0578039.1 hypothetical protein H2248_005578 [Termitomyces sp. 'cryptogamus']KAH0578051.1 hypothetical protein H2248_005590 [Termitomyces sp. 'cryptogamus']